MDACHSSLRLYANKGTRNVPHRFILCGPSQTPRLLVVLGLPRDRTKWLTITAEELILRRSAYWLNLRRHDETENKSSITVHIPEQNLFNVDNLRMLMEQSRKGSIQ